MTPEKPSPTNADLMAEMVEIRSDARANEHERDDYRHETATLALDVSRQINEIALSVDKIRTLSYETANSVARVVHLLGEEPTTDGAGGRGLIGDVRKTSRDMQSLMDLRKMGLGAIGAVVLFGTLIVFGVTYWIKGLFPAAAATP